MAVELAFSKFVSRSGSSKPSISILHGLLGSKANWRSMGKKLSLETDRTVYCLDIRNHSDSPRSPDMSYDVMIRDFSLFMAKQKLEKTIMIGHSMGGKVAMSYSLTYPHLIDGLIVVDVSPSVSQRSMFIHNIISLLSSVDLSLIKDRRQIDEQLREKISDDVLRSFVVSGLVIDKKTGSMKWRTNFEAVKNNEAELVNFPSFQDHSYTGPTLFIGGSQSNYISDSHLPSIKRLFPKAVVTHVEGAGHWLHSEKPNEFKELVKNFLSSNQL